LLCPTSLLPTLLRHPPRSPLSPYTPLFRSLAVGTVRHAMLDVEADELLLPGLEGHTPPQRGEHGLPARPHVAGAYALRDLGGGRSEEHTSELQSRGHLVCRLLLEKKNIQDQ